MTLLYDFGIYSGELNKTVYNIHEVRRYELLKVIRESTTADRSTQSMVSNLEPIDNVGNVLNEELRRNLQVEKERLSNLQSKYEAKHKDLHEANRLLQQQSLSYGELSVKVSINIITI